MKKVMNSWKSILLWLKVKDSKNNQEFKQIFWKKREQKIGLLSFFSELDSLCALLNEMESSALSVDLCRFDLSMDGCCTYAIWMSRSIFRSQSIFSTRVINNRTLEHDVSFWIHYYTTTTLVSHPFPIYWVIFQDWWRNRPYMTAI